MNAKQSPQGQPATRLRKVIRLAPGMRFEGTVKAVADYGAFVDIGVGRDGLVHITEVSRKPVAQITDVLREGDKVTVWIKDLDRERNRISLTMVDPNAPSLEDLREGDIVRGRVTRLERYGAFLDIGVEREALLHVREMGKEFVSRPEEVVRVGQELEVRVIHVDVQRRRVDVSLKGLDEEEEADEPEAAQVAPEEAKEEEPPTPMQVALEEALRRQEKRSKRAKGRKGEERSPARQKELDEIIRRTLESHRST
ncbi:MAG: S1 RNA-binding domain-containing protein [Anaerolineae bacterium]